MLTLIFKAIKRAAAGNMLRLKTSLESTEGLVFGYVMKIQAWRDDSPLTRTFFLERNYQKIFKSIIFVPIHS